MSEQVNNPTGIGGFADHPELINNKGAPIAITTWRAILKRIGDEFTQDDEGNSVLRRELICRAMYLKAKDDPRYATTIMDREEGKPEQRQIHAGEEEAPAIRIIHAYNGNGRLHPDTEAGRGTGGNGQPDA